MHTGYKQTVSVSHPELGAMVAKYVGSPDADLPNFVRMGPTGNAGSGFLGPQYSPFSLDRDGRLPYFTLSYANAQAERRRTGLLHFVESDFAKEHKAKPFEAHRLAQERVWRCSRRRRPST